MSASAIERIRAMQAAGTITPAQAEELIAALAGGDEPPGGPEPGPASTRGPGRFLDMEWVGDMVDGITSGLGIINDSADPDPRPEADRTGYRYEWSRGRRTRGGWGPAQVASPTGEQFEFKNNKVTFSRMTGVKLVRARMKDNTLSAASLSDAEITDGSMEDCLLAGASVAELRITGGRMKGVLLKGCKVHRLTVGRGSVLKDTRITGAGVTDLSLDGDSVLEDTSISGGAVNAFSVDLKSEVKDCRLAGMSLTRLALEGSRLKDSSFRGSWISEGLLQDSSLENCDLRGARIQRLDAKRSRLRDCRFDGSGFATLTLESSSLRHVAFRDSPGESAAGPSAALTITDCSLDNLDFSGCVFRNTTLKGLKADGLRFRGVDFSGRTIETVDDLRNLAG